MSASEEPEVWDFAGVRDLQVQLKAAIDRADQARDRMWLAAGDRGWVIHHMLVCRAELGDARKILRSIEAEVSRRRPKDE